MGGLTDFAHESGARADVLSQEKGKNAITQDKLNNLRNSFTFISNFLVLGMGLIIFKFMSDPPLEYRIISYIVVTLGISASLFFLFTVREVPLSKACHEKAEKLKKQLEEEKKFIIQEGTSSV